MILVLLLVVVFLSPSVFAGSITVTIDLHESTKLQPEAKKLIKKAAQITFDRIAEYSVANCAYRNSERSGTSDQLRKRWGRQIPHLNKSRKVHISITAASIGKGVLGTARVGSAKIDRHWHKIENLAINLNSDLIHSHLKRHQGSQVTAVDLWVNTIAHEVAHTLGYSHGTSGNWSRDYPGYFPTELGFCVMTNGRYGSDMGDVKKRRR